MKEWKVQLTRHAEIDLYGIYEYIASTLLEPVVAWNLIQRIETRITKLNTMPQKLAVYPKEPWKSRGLRRVNEGKYAVFYIPTEKNYTVTVIRIVYGGRDIDHILDETTLDYSSEPDNSGVDD